MLKTKDCKMPEQDAKLIKQTAGEWERYRYFDSTEKKWKQGMRKVNSGTKTKTNFKQNKTSVVPPQQPTSIKLDVPYL